MVKGIVHHASEAAAFLALGTLALSKNFKADKLPSFGSTLTAYTIGKASYLVVKKLAMEAGFSKQVARNSGWAAALVLGSSVLPFALNKLSNKSMGIFDSLKTTAGVTLLSIAARTLVDKGVKQLSKLF
ncbi:MAG: hypothetical protein HKM07_04900 [Chlamydiae bacterium]|nr:hypothetical protein [Chlamydiota bacterium]